MKLRMAEGTERFVANFAASLPHAVLLIGPAGAGLRTLALHVAQQNGRLLTVLTPEAKTSSSLAVISVERIRQLYTETRARLDGPHFVIIDDADAMNASAQNALLKLLEEPNESIHFILTTHSPDKLLPTIRSRVQSFVVPQISMLESKRLMKSLGVDDALSEQRLLYVAVGLPAELSRLCNDQADFRALLERVQKARQFVEGNQYQRLALIQSFKDDRQSAIVLIDTIIMLLRRSLSTSPDRGTVKSIERLVEASELIRANGNIKLQLSRAVV